MGPRSEMIESNVVELPRPPLDPAQSLVRDALRGWSATLAIACPAGTVRHPRVLDRVRDELGRSCVFDTEGNGIRVAFEPEGDLYEEVDRDSRFVVSHVLGMLRLPPETPVQLRLYRVDQIAQVIGELLTPGSLDLL